MQKIAMGLEYNGTHYYGWQRQERLSTVQSCVETALSTVANHPLVVVCAGRTDAGVHALEQVIHFESDAERSGDNWIMGGNAHLPNTIAIRWVKNVDLAFHARYSALSRAYRYIIYNHPLRSAIFQQNTTWSRKFLDENRMQKAANFLLGEHDFTSFRGINCQAKTAVRTITQLDIERHGDFIVIDVKANAFLHHMVRNIAGVLIAIGEGKRAVPWAKEVLLARDRTKAGITAPPGGLYLMEVKYSEKWQIPQTCSREI